MKSEHKLRIIPLGGLGEIGKNMMVIEYGPSCIVIDAGLMFPNRYTPGVDYIIPDISYLNGKNIAAVFLTHGHEDHIGAIAHYIQRFNCPIYGKKLTLAFVRDKLIEARVNKRNYDLREAKPREAIKAGPFSVEFINVNHSIVDSAGLAIKTPLGTVIHTGDFKVDLEPFDDDVIDLARFSEYGEKGALLLLADSTNAERQGVTLSEKYIRAELKNLFAQANGMIVAVTFASSIHRIQELVNAAHENGKRVAFSGRSLLKYTAIAEKLGYIKFPENTIIPIEDIKRHPRNSIVCIVTGSQGEPYSSLALIANKSHKHVRVEQGDIVIISASVIPGNETSVNDMVNPLFGMGAMVINESQYKIHSSGHASQEELKLMHRLVKPKYFAPIHGEKRHLITHANIARALHKKEENVFVMYNGNVLEISPHSARVLKEPVPAGPIYVSGKIVGGLSEGVFKDRISLAANGIVLVSATTRNAQGKPEIGAVIESRGFLVANNGHSYVLDEARDKIYETIQSLIRRGKTKPALMKYEIKAALETYFAEEVKRDPLIVVFLNGA